MADELQTVYRPSKPWIPVRVRERRDLTTATVSGKLAAGVDAPVPSLTPAWPAAAWVAGEGNLARFLVDTSTMDPGPYSVFLRVQDSPEDLIIRAAGVLWVR